MKQKPTKRTNQNRTLMIATAVAAAIFVLLLMFSGGLFAPSAPTEREEIIDKPEFRGIARKNKLLGAELLAGRRGNVSRLKNLARFEPAPNDVLVINNPTHTLSERAADYLLDWVDRGGTIIIEASGGVFTDDPFLEQLDIEVKPSDGLQSGTVRVPEYDYEINISSDRYLDGSSYRHYLSDQLEPQVGVARHGRGEVFLFTSFKPFYTRNLDEAEHADFIADLTWNANKAWFMYTIFVPPISDEFWKKAWYVILSILLALALWAWSSSLRIGRLLPPEKPVRRSLMEHISAAGRYLWKVPQGREQLCAAVRQATTRELEQHFPGWKSVPEDKRVILVVKLVEQALTPQQVREALFADDVPKNLIADVISRLALIRSAL